MYTVNFAHGVIRSVCCADCLRIWSSRTLVSGVRRSERLAQDPDDHSRGAVVQPGCQPCLSDNKLRTTGHKANEKKHSIYGSTAVLHSFFTKYKAARTVQTVSRTCDRVRDDHSYLEMLSL